MGPKVKNMDGLRREDAARDNMRQYGFDEVVISESIEELVELYGEDGWKLIEDGGYSVLLTRCLEKQEEQAKEVAKEEQTEEAAVEEMASPDNAQRSVRGANDSDCGWLSEEEEEEEMDLDDDTDDGGDNDNKMIRLIPEPLCEELQQLLREVHGEN